MIAKPIAFQIRNIAPILRPQASLLRVGCAAHFYDHRFIVSSSAHSTSPDFHLLVEQACVTYDTRRMHRCLSVLDILLTVFEDAVISPIDLARIATTCRTFSEPALDILWRDPGDIAAILGTMAPDLWRLTEAKDDTGHYCKDLVSMQIPTHSTLALRNSTAITLSGKPLSGSTPWLHMLFLSDRKLLAPVRC